MLRILSPAERIGLGLLLVYTLFRFLTGISEVIRQPDAFPVGAASAIWLYFFAFSAMYAQRLLALDPAEASE